MVNFFYSICKIFSLQSGSEVIFVLRFTTVYGGQEIVGKEYKYMCERTYGKISLSST